ncbi:MAG: transcriptional repressor [Hyphomicrobiales bacterium]|nr:MAG: transcriptional repressor [Hyphomicrobiales bacterium]
MSHLSVTKESDIAASLRDAGLRPTRQRLALGGLLFAKGNRHVTAESLHQEVNKTSGHVSLATVYNTLHQFTDAGLLREINVTGSKSFFCTNIADHHHFYLEQDDELIDIDGENIRLSGLPTPPDGTRIDQVEVVIRLKKDQ